VDGKLVAESGLLSDVHLIPSTRINAIIVTAPAKTMTLIEKLIEELDTASAARSIVKVFQLKKAQASLMANLIRQLFTGQQQVGVGGIAGLGAAGALQAGQPRPLLTPTGEVAEGALLVDLRLTVDDRTNSLIVAGSRTDMDLIEALIARLEDTETEERFYEVYKLKNTSAADVQNAVNQFIVDSLNVLTATTPTTGGSFLDAYQRLQKDVVLVAEPVSNTLLVSATPRLFKDIKRIIERLDAQPPQVMIQVMIADVQLNNAMEFGLEVGLQSRCSSAWSHQPRFQLQHHGTAGNWCSRTRYRRLPRAVQFGSRADRFPIVRRLHLHGLEPVVERGAAGSASSGTGRNPQPAASAGHGQPGRVHPGGPGLPGSHQRQRHRLDHATGYHLPPGGCSHAGDTADLTRWQDHHADRAAGLQRQSQPGQPGRRPAGTGLQHPDSPDHRRGRRRRNDRPGRVDSPSRTAAWKTVCRSSRTFLTSERCSATGSIRCSGARC
jgi:hypothetical protein